jgi:hypothetical protein
VSHLVTSDEGTLHLTRRPAGRAPPSRKESRPAKLTPRGGRRSDRLPSANFTMAPTPRLGFPVAAPVAGEVDGLGVDTERAAGGGFWRRPAALAVVTYPGRRSPGHSRFPHRWRGPRTNPSRRRGRRISPPSGRGSVLPLLRQRTEAEQPPSWWAPSE